MSWFIKYDQYVENIRKKAHDEGIALGSDDEIIIKENDLPAGELLYSIIYLTIPIYYF